MSSSEKQPERFRSQKNIVMRGPMDGNMTINREQLKRSVTASNEDFKQLQTELKGMARNLVILY
jgi:hypothetical protein